MIYVKFPKMYHQLPKYKGGTDLGAVIEPEPIMNVIVKCPKLVKTSKAKEKDISRY